MKMTFLEKKRNLLYRHTTIQMGQKEREIDMYLYMHPPKDVDQKLLELSRDLKRVHKKIKERIFDALEFPPCVFGFVKGKSIKDAAEVHVGKETIISLDMKDFFPSTKSDFVLESLRKNFGFGEMASWLIARLVARRGVLPQGAITSPGASNVAFYDKDLALMEFAERHNLVYTRYADDLTFSSDENIEDATQLLSEVAEIIKPYRLNFKKVKVYRGRQRKYVLGLVVNRKLNVPKEYKRTVIAAIHNYVVKNKVPPGEDPIKYKRKLKGKINYIASINPTRRVMRFKKMLDEFDPNKVKKWGFIGVDVLEEGKKLFEEMLKLSQK